MAILNNSNAISSGGYDINNSLRIRRSNNAYLSRTPASAGNQQTWTYSAWVKRGLLGSIQDIWHANGSGTSENDYFAFDSDTLQFRIKNSNTVVCELITTQVFRDPSAWYHIVLAWDSTQATSSNRVKIYINGTQITAFTTATYPAQNTNTNSYNSTVLHTIGTQWYNSTLSNYYDGYITEVNFVNAQALTPSSFGETDTTTGSWKPKAYSGTYGTNGFYLKFSDIATTSGSNAGLGKDFSGNTNYWTTNNISVTSGTTYDAMKDSPTNTSATVANYAVLNPVDKSTGTITNANLTYASSSGFGARSTISMSSGKWYCEVTCSTASDNMLGILSSTENISTLSFPGNTSTSYGYYSSNGNKYNNGTSTAYGASYTTNDIIGIAFDADAGTLTYYKNGVSQGTAFSSIPSGSYSFGYGNGTSGGSFNFGQRPFSYTPPTGYVALNTYNLPTPTILQGNKYMDATLWSGNGSTQVVVNQALFQPDLVWIKSRAGNNGNSFNLLYDSIRGAGKFVSSNTTNAEAGNSGDLLGSFNSNGFSSGVTLNYVDGAIIDYGDGFDTNSPNRTLRIIPWSVTVKTLDDKFNYVIPSQGSPINQVKFECFSNGQIKQEVLGNQSMYNGSIRTYWSSPQYGYFDISKITKPSPEQYLKNILLTSQIQENFSLNGINSYYDDISEIFSVFEKDVLDRFENEFLNFSRSVYDYKSNIVSENDTETEYSTKNFQFFMREMMKVPYNNGTTGTQTVENISNNQFIQMNKFLIQFLEYDVVFKYGNPSNFDKRLFYTFSNLPITEPYTWDSYKVSTPNALPTNGISVSLSQSQTNYPYFQKYKIRLLLESHYS